MKGSLLICAWQAVWHNISPGCAVTVPSTLFTNQVGSSKKITYVPGNNIY